MAIPSFPAETMLESIENARLRAAAIQNKLQMMPFDLEAKKLSNEENALKNKWYSPKAEADIGLTRAQTEHYPFANALMGAQTQGKMLENSFLPRMTEADIAYKNALTKGASQRTSPEALDAMRVLTERRQQLIREKYLDGLPAEDKRQISSVLRGAGVPEEEGWKRLRMGETMPQILADKGVSREQVMPRPVPNNQIIKQEQQASIANDVLEKVSPLLGEWSAPYKQTYGGISPDLEKDYYLRGSNPKVIDKIGKYGAAIAYSLDEAAERNRQLGIVPGVTTLEHMVQNAMANGHIPERMRTPEVYESMRKNLDLLFRKSREAAQDSYKKLGKPLPKSVHMMSPTGETYDVPKEKIDTFLNNNYRMVE